ncbi:MAG: DUF6452 family protein [Bacteroidales bacterium]
MQNSIIRNIFITGFLAIVFSGILQSCEGECVELPESLSRINFHSIIDSVDRPTPVDSLSVYGLGREDSLLYSLRNNISFIDLPLDGNAGESAFVLLFDNIADTLWIEYEVIPVFESPECGFMLNFELSDARHTINMIDSVVILINQVTSFEDTNIRIYH